MSVTAAPQASSAPGRAVARPVAAVATVGLAAFVTALDNSVLTVALPTIDRELGLGRLGVEWVGAGYLLSFAALLLVGGRFADRWGRSEALCWGTVVFAASSATAALSPSGPLLVASRVVQGVGAALLLPAALAVLAADLDGRARRLAAGVFTAAIAAALALGPVVGGVLTEHLGWRSVFWLNVPIGVLTIVVARRSLPRREASAAGSGPLDIPGLAASCLGLVGLVAALVEWHGSALTARVWVCIGAAVLGWTVFVLVERRAVAPLVPRALLRHPVFAGGTAAQVLWGVGMNGVVFFTSTYLQVVLGLSPSAAGLMFVPVALAVAVAVAPASWLVERAGAAVVVASGLAVVGLGLFLVAIADPADGVRAVLPGLVVIGIGSGLTTPLTDCVLSVVDRRDAGVASAVVSAAREMSGVIGIAVVGLILTRQESAALLRGASAAGAFASGYRAALFVSVVVLLAGALVAAVSMPGRARR